MLMYEFYEWPLPMEFDNLTMGQGWASIVSLDGQFIGLAPGSRPDWRGTYRNEQIEKLLFAAIEQGTAILLDIWVCNSTVE